MDELKELLKQHESLSFPSGYHGKTIEGVNLTIANSECVGLIYGLIETGGTMSTRSKQTILKHTQGLNNLATMASNTKEHAKLIPFVNSLLTLIKSIGLQ